MRTRVFPLLMLLLCVGCTSQPRVVLYCAQDEEFAVDVLDTFKKQTGITVAPKFDTEKDKSVSLYISLVNEKARPRCDVFWNNEILSTIRLQKQGMLEPYDSPSAKPYPDTARAKDHTWHAFAARARVLLVNTKLVKDNEMPKSLLDLANPKWKGRVAMAKPNFGTSATQAACLFDVMGEEGAKKFYRDLKANDIQIVPGNKQVAEAVRDGQAALGVTDTDDALGEMKSHTHLAMVFPDRDRPKDDKMGTLFIPNTVAIIRGGPDLAGAKKLVDYLLSPEVEKKLAESDSHQVPLNPEVKVTLPDGLETPATVKAMTVNFEHAADLWETTQTFLRAEFATP